MSKPIVFCTENEYIITPKIEAYLREYVDFRRAEKKLTPDELVERIGNAQGLISMGYPINKRLLDKAASLRIVSTTSAGYDVFDLEEMRAHHVVGLHTPGVLNPSVAELVLLLMLGVSRRAAEMDRLVRSGGWETTPFYQLFGSDMNGKKVGIIGMGQIGQEVAKKCKLGFDMEVSYYNRHRRTAVEEELGVTYQPMDELMVSSDYVVTLVPLDSTTHHIVGAKELALMKPSAFFINAARGPVVDEAALCEALKSGQIRGAGLDVYEVEPIGAGNPLTALPNTFLLPHIGSGTAECREAMGWLAAQGLVEFFSGQQPRNLIPFFK